MKRKNPTDDEDSSADGQGKSGLVQRIMEHPGLEKYRERSWWRTETFMIGGAIVAGLFSAALSHASRTAYREQIEKKFQTQRIVVAARELSPGTVLTKSHLAPAAYLKGNLSSNFVPVENLGNILGRSIMVELKPGDPVLLTAVTGADMADRMAEKVPAGKRLFTMTISDHSAALLLNYHEF